jgi:hypothetical protein
MRHLKFTSASRLLEIAKTVIHISINVTWQIIDDNGGPDILCHIRSTKPCPKSTTRTITRGHTLKRGFLTPNNKHEYNTYVYTNS